MPVLSQSGSRAAGYAAAAVLSVIVILLRRGALQHGFIVLDDYVYVLRNPFMTASWREALAEGFSAIVAGMWHPLTLWSLKMDVSLWGLHAGPIAFTNVVLHAANAGLLLLLLRRLSVTLPFAIAGASLFAFHAAHVESYAWVSERKDVLSALFFLIALHAWISWRAGQRWTAYVGVVVAFAAGILSKPMVVTLPAVLVLLEVFLPGGVPRRRAIAHLAPLFMLSAAASAMTIHAQSSDGALRSLAITSILSRLEAAIAGYGWYLRTWLYPSGRALFHPQREISLTEAGIAVVVFAVITLLVWRERRSAPLAIIGWLWFCGVLFPVSGVLQVGLQSVADRYLYLPAIGLVLMIVALAERFTPAGTARRVVATCLGIAVVFHAIASSRQFALWRDSVLITGQSARMYPQSGFAQFLYAISLSESGRCGEAVPVFRNANDLAGRVELRAGAVHESWLGTSHRELARCLRTSGSWGDALAAADRAVQLDRRDAPAWLERGDVQLALGRMTDAETSWQTAERLDPTLSGELLVRRAEAALMAGNFRGAESWARAAAERDDSSAAWRRLGRALAGRGDLPGAVRALERAVLRDPTDAEAQLNLGVLYAESGQRSRSFTAIAEAARLRPQWVDPRIHLALSHADAGRFSDAANELERALTIDRDRTRLRFLQITGLAPETHSAEGYVEYLRGKASTER